MFRRQSAVYYAKICTTVLLAAGTLQLLLRCSDFFAVEANGITRPSFEKSQAQKMVSLQTEVTLYPNDAEKHNRLGLALLELQEFNKAVIEFRISSKLR